MKKFLKIIGIIFAVLLIIGMIDSLFDGNKENSDVKAVEPSTEVVTSKWKYTESTDPMDNRKTTFATIKSDNILQFDFPYDGGSTFEFIIRNDLNKNKIDLLLRVSKGQFMNNILGDEYLRIKFDENQAFTWKFGSAADASSDVIFPVYSKDFLTQLKASKKMMIEAPFAFAGRQVIYFTTENLKRD